MRRAFTLVELAISLAVGLLAVLAAYHALRVTALTTRQVSRLALQNQVMRDGMLAAYDELDFWTNYDDPTDLANQGLRGGSTQATDPLGRQYLEPGSPQVELTRDGAPVRMGLAFTPLATFATANYDGAPAADLVPSAADRPLVPATWLRDAELERLDRQRALDLDSPYQADDPRRWWRGSLSDGAAGYRHFGRYALVANLRRDPVIDLYGTVDAAAFPRHVGSRLPATWLPNQMIQLHDALGSYGLLEYQPANVQFAFYGSAEDPAAGGDPNAWMRSSLAQTGLYRRNDFAHYGRYVSHYAPTPLHHSLHHAVPLFPLTVFSGSPVIQETVDASVNADTGNTTNLSLALGNPTRFRSHARARWPGGEAQITILHVVVNRATTIRPLMPLRPDEWPDVQLGIFRSIACGRFIQQVRLRWYDPATSEMADLPVNGIGTTLRGARQQRHPNRSSTDPGGWARWFGAGDARNEPTLDTP